MDGSSLVTFCEVGSIEWRACADALELEFFRSPLW